MNYSCNKDKELLQVNYGCYMITIPKLLLIFTQDIVCNQHQDHVCVKRHFLPHDSVCRLMLELESTKR